ncbi:MAG: RidA family protein [Pseudomonadota bacterium]|nr:RidA family protein [Pseudomonadota bacterium]
MLKKHNPATVATPLSSYSHGVDVPPKARWMCLSGQIAIAPDGSVPEGIEAQSTLVFENIKNILASGDMELEDLVRLNVYIVNPNDMAGFRTVRDKYVGDIKCGSTMIVIAGLAKPEFLIEIEAMAAKSDG